MTVKKERIVMQFACDKAMLKMIKRNAKKNDLSGSQYLRSLVRQDDLKIKGAS